MSTNGWILHRTSALIVAAVLALPAAALAQKGQKHRHGQEGGQGERGQRPGMMQMPGTMMGMQEHGGMMGMMAAPSPTMLLHQREALVLTDEQVESLEALRERLAGRRGEHMESMRAAHERLAEQAKHPDLDLAAYESAFRSLADAHVAMQVETARAGQQARELLSAEQRARLRTGMQFMRGMHGPMMKGMRGERSMGAMQPEGGMGAMRDAMPCRMTGGSGGSKP